MAVEPGSPFCEHGLWQVHSNAMQSKGVTQDCWTVCVDNTTYCFQWRHVVTHLLPSLCATTCRGTTADGGLPPAPIVQDEYVSSRWDNPLGRSRSSRGSDSERVWEQEERGCWPEPGPGHLPEPATASVYIKVIRGIKTTGRCCLPCVLWIVCALSNARNTSST
jgi:hypothetical protein